MKITPLDVRHKKFGRSLLGYASLEVSSFLSDVREELENVLRELRDKEEEIIQLEKVLAEFRERESALKQTLISAQRVSEDIKKNTEKEAQMIIEQAEMQADKLIVQAHSRLKQVIEQIQEVKRQKAEFIGRFKGMIEGHSRLLGMAEEEHNEKSLEDIGLLPKGL